ncbi:phosphotransferase [Leucobacter sp. wl10]|uniref:phosphotransferase n=1 Tax=Leucobacter sp. wl10 TaxID=2304677 RepID=UPI000E5B98D2|nr:phosphotransferase [Leucobacter sp. wl10]RGE24267.1 hypothetical protein D1J51_00520 [Leucobacter sp. wl10]
MTASALRASRSASTALQSLAERDPALPDLPLVLDDRRRADALGRATTIEWLRYKPGTSIVAAVRDAADRPLWVAAYAETATAAKVAVRAGQAGAEPTRLSSGALAGPVHTDRLLSGAITRVFGSAAAHLGGAEVIRYNPYRRLVLRTADHALKLTSPGGARHAVAAALAAEGHPVLAPVRVERDAWAFPWWGDGDLARRDAPEQAVRAGRALAAIHAAPFDRLGVPTLDAAGIARTSAAAIATVLPRLAGRAHALAARLSGLPVASRVLCHGDWSADQVLTDGTEVRIIDFDRAVAAPREHDLGAYLAAGGDAAMLEGYRAGSARLDDDLLRGWQAFAQLQRASAPFRRGAADWPAEIERALRRAEELRP